MNDSPVPAYARPRSALIQNPPDEFPVHSLDAAVRHTLPRFSAEHEMSLESANEADQARVVEEYDLVRIAHALFAR